MYSSYKMSSHREELSLPVEWDIIDACNGFSFDMGGSVMKLVFVDKKDYVEPAKRKKGSKGIIKLVNFARGELDEAFKFINDRVRFNRKDKTENVDFYSTGYGGTQYAADIKKQLNATNIQLDEGGALIQGLLLLMNNYPKKEILYEPYKPAYESAKKQLAKNLTLYSDPAISRDSFKIFKTMDDYVFTDGKITDEEKPFADGKNFFPCGFMIAGSGFGFAEVHKNGQVYFTDGSYMGGKTFLALGSLLTNSKNYDEFMDLANRGHSNQVSETNLSLLKDLKKSQNPDSAGDENDPYNKFVELTESGDYQEEVIFYFGQAVNKSISDFKREDLARCLLETYCLYVAHITHSAAEKRGLKDVFLCGGFVNHPLTREIFTLEWLRRDYFWKMAVPEKPAHINLHFLKHGQSLGAIGALLNHRDKWSKPPAPASEASGKKPASAQSGTKKAGYKAGTGL